MDPESKGVVLVGGGFLAIVAAIGIGISSFTTIPTGEVGVVSWFGEVSDTTLGAGLHFVNPLKKVKRWDIKTQKNEEPATVPTQGGLPVQLKATLQYHIDPLQVPRLAREVGSEDFEARIIDPVFKNVVRDVCSEFSPEALYTGERNKVEQQVKEAAQRDLTPRGIVVEAVMLLDPILPAVVAERISAKVGAEQDVMRMQSVLKTRELEAQAKVVEAKGIAEAQAIIKKDLDINYIRYLWVQALANHPGAVIYVPTGSDGLPVIKTMPEPAK